MDQEVLIYKIKLKINISFTTRPSEKTSELMSLYKDTLNYSGDISLGRLPFSNFILI